MLKVTFITLNISWNEVPPNDGRRSRKHLPLTMMRLVSRRSDEIVRYWRHFECSDVSILISVLNHWTFSNALLASSMNDAFMLPFK